MHELIEKAWNDRSMLRDEEVVLAIEGVVERLDRGELRVAEPQGDGWKVNEWVKKAVLMYFPIKQMHTFEVGPLEFHDKIPLKKHYAKLGVRVVPHAIARHGSHLAPGVILMPSYVNIGAYVDEGTMVDTWATVGSCAQIGKHVHLSGGVGIGGVLEPLQASPVIIEDNVFIGARSEVAEGCIVRQGAVLSMGCYLGQSTRIYNARTREVTHGEIPERAVVVPGTLPSRDGSHETYALIIKKFRDEKTDARTALNDILR